MARVAGVHQARFKGVWSRAVDGQGVGPIRLAYGLSNLLGTELRGYPDVGQHRLVAFTNTIAVAVEPDEPMTRHRRPSLSEGLVLARLGIGRRRQRERQQCGA